jgi:hypothetical protein
MEFSEALHLMKDGKKLQRICWNKAQFVFITKCSIYITKNTPLQEMFPKNLVEIPYREHIDLKTNKGFVIPYTPTQEDLLSADWVEI